MHFETVTELEYLYAYTYQKGQNVNKQIGNVFLRVKSFKYKS